jgi:hypothetical protein
VGRVQPAGLAEAVEAFDVVALGSVPDAVARDLEAASLELESLREADPLAKLAERLEARASEHARFAWLAGHARRIAESPAGWDGVHRPGK